jgi:hypothetical protein
MSEPPREAYEAAEKLVREAHARAEEAARDIAEEIPERGWSAGAPRHESSFPDLAALLGLLELAKGAIPPELARQLADALRELLIAIRAILDYTIERLERPSQGEPEVEDIPVT